MECRFAAVLALGSLASACLCANHGTNISGAQNINLPSTYGGGAKSAPEFAARLAAPLRPTNLPGLLVQLPVAAGHLDKRFSHGLSFTSAFTWGKGLATYSGDDGGLMFFINWRRNYAPVDWDRALNFEQSFTYELPFGRGHTMLQLRASGMPCWGMEDLRHHLGVLSGLPFTVTANGGTLNTPGTPQTATLVKPFHKLGGIGATKSVVRSDLFLPALRLHRSIPCTNPGLGIQAETRSAGPGTSEQYFGIQAVHYLS